jgi:glycosyl transferase family 2
MPSAPAANGVPSLSVIVPATNGPATLTAAVEALRASFERADELIVVTESPDPSRAGSANDAALARNAGARVATGDVLVFVDADVAVHRDALGRIRTAFEGDVDLVALVGGYDDDPPAPGLVSQYRNLRLFHAHQDESGPGMFWNALGAIRREVFEELDGFDVDFLPDLNAIQDIGLGIRLRQSGKVVRADPRIQGTHLKVWRLGQILRTDLATATVARVMLLTAEDEPGPVNAEADVSSGASARNVARAACLVAAGAVIMRRPRLALAATAVFIAANRSLVTLLYRKRGPAFAAAGMGLRALEELATLPAPILAARAYAQHRRQEEI